MSGKSNPTRSNYSPIYRFLSQIVTIKINKYIEPGTHSYSYLFFILLIGTISTITTIWLGLKYFLFSKDVTFSNLIYKEISYFASIGVFFLGTGITLAKRCWKINRNLSESFYLYEIRAVLQFAFVLSSLFIGAIALYHLLVYLFT